MLSLVGLVNDQGSSDDERTPPANIERILWCFAIFAKHNGIPQFKDGPVITIAVFGNRFENRGLLTPLDCVLVYRLDARRRRSSRAPRHDEACGGWIIDCVIGYGFDS